MIEPAFLDAIAQEVRQCFLEEDAPTYLEVLQTGLQQSQELVDYPSLRRAAHSLKGGAGLVQIPNLSELAHKLEDLLQALEQQQVTDKQQAWALLHRAVEQIAMLLTQARSSQDCRVDPNLLQALEEFQPLSSAETKDSGSTAVADAHLIKTALEVDLENCLVRVEQLLQDEDTSAQAIFQSLSTLVEECTLLGEALDLPWLIQAVVPISTALGVHENESVQRQAQDLIIQLRSLRSQYLQDKLLIPKKGTRNGDARSQASPPSSLRIPLSQLEHMANTIGELIINHERRNLQQQQLEQTSQRLQQLISQFEPIRDQLQTRIEKRGSNYGLHFQKLILQIQEIQADLDLMNREAVEDQEEARQNLHSIYTALLQSRLVPFKKLAQRFLPQLSQLNHHYGKSVELVIQGEDVLVDLVLLEQLQAPLTHLLNNAFDHGIENLAERLASAKPEIARIILQATANENQVVITFKDDGRGIDLHKIYRQAVQQGFCSHTPISDLGQEEILAFLFQPGFSTAPTVNALSGRGMGLDIVQTQISRLRGTVQVQTLIGQGTTFTIKLPPGLSLLPLLLCQQQRLVAIPTTSVLEILSCSELTQISTTPPLVNWRGRTIPIVPLLALLPYPNLSTDSRSRVAIVVDGPDSPLIVTVDALVGERQLILKPFDDTVAIPPYLAGCTILETGEVVPVVLPYHFDRTAYKPRLVPTLGQTHPSGQARKRTILVAEDSAANRHLLERILTQEGYTVVLCRDGQEALDELEQRHNHVDLVISDIEMPRIDGFVLLRQIRSSSHSHALPVVMLTSRTGSRDQQKAMSEGATSYMNKPIETNKLLSGINLLLKRSVAKHRFY